MRKGRLSRETDTLDVVIPKLREFLGAGAGRCRGKPRSRCDLEAGGAVAFIPQEDVMVNQIGRRRVTCTLLRPHWNL